MVSQKYFVCATDGTIWIPRVRFFAGRHHLQWGPKVNGLSCIQYMGATWINSKPLPGIILIPSVCNFFMIGSFGSTHMQGSLECLKPRGYMVSFGESSGMPDPVPLSALAAKSLFLTRPSLRWYNSSRDELLECATELLTKVATGVLRVRVNHSYYLSQAAQAHAELEARKTSGSVVLIPDAA